VKANGGKFTRGASQVAIPVTCVIDIPAILPATFGVWLRKTRARARARLTTRGRQLQHAREKIERNVVEMKEKERGKKGDGRLKHRDAAKHAE